MNTQPLHSADFCPFKGLDPYTEDYRDYFFGRERDQKTIISNLHATPLTILYGASGVGKSSVLMAGVVPQLRQMPRRAIVIFRSWQGDNFVEVLKREVLSAIRKSADGEARVDPAQSFERFLIDCNEALGGPIFFILDQFEEYFLYHPPSKAEDSFDAFFARAVNRKDINAKFLLAMREEELSKLDRFRGRIPNLLGNTLRLKQLDRESAERAIREPLLEYNRHVADVERMGIEDELVAALIEKATPGKDVFSQVTERSNNFREENSDAHVETPVLQMLLTRLWNEEKKAGSHTLRLNTFEGELRGAESIMGTYLKEIMDRLTEPELEIAAGVFRFLVTPSRTKVAQDPGVLASWADLDEQQVQAILTRLSSQEDMRLLRKVRVPGQSARYEIFHDVLARAILEWRAEYVRAKDQAKGERRAAREAARKEKEAAQQLQLQQAQALAEAERKQAEEQRRRGETERRRAEEQVAAHQREMEQAQALAVEQGLRAEAEHQRAEEQERRIEEQARATKRLRWSLVALAVFLLVTIWAMVFVAKQNSEANKEAHADRLAHDGVRLREEGKDDEALEKFQQALPLFQETGNQISEARMLKNIGAYYYPKGKGPPEKALEAYRRALPLWHSLGDQAEEADTSENIGQIYSRLDQKDKALEYLIKALKLYLEKDGSRDAARMYFKGAWLHNDLNQKEKAISFYNNALKLYQDIGDKENAAATLSEIGKVYSSLEGQKQ